jgi:hypothetical protein
MDQEMSAADMQGSNPAQEQIEDDGGMTGMQQQEPAGQMSDGMDM